MAGQFSDFYLSLDADPMKRGKQFEHFVKWFLRADPEWATQVDQVWLWEEWPERWGADCGVDLVFRHKNGEYWAVQAKCYSPDYHITKHDVDKFLSESNRKGIHHRLLIATTDFIGGNAKQVCEAQEKPVIRFLLSDFERAALDYPANFAALPQAKRKARPTPRDHQNEARIAVMQGLQTADRGQLIMACGTGKTYVTLWIKEALNAQRTLVLVPSLGLLSQLLREWTFAAATPFEVLCVCSDQTVGTKGNDEAIHSVADLAFPVTSDADEVKRFLSGAGNRVVFSTYQSSSVIAAAQADATIPAFDLAVADEAHRCAGKVGSDFTAILDNAQIRSTKRLFATATPRTYSSTVHKAAEDRGVEVVGMDNATLFGEVLYALPFGKAIERKLLTDYRVVIIGVDDPTIAQWIANRELVTTGTGIETDSESLAAQIGLLKAIKDYDLKRIISFHSRVNRAEAFTTDIQNTMAWISDEHRPSGTLRTDFVSGNMPANKRKIKLDQLKALSADERGVLSNARCLSEGVDVPSLDGVAFIDPRSSQVDIIQAVGRAIRLSPDKKIGTIVLPVFIATGENAEDTIEASHFKPIWDVLNALKAHDDVLACELDQVRTELGRKPGTGISANGLRKITIDLPATVGANFSSALRTYLVEQVTASWSFWFGLLEAFVERERHAKVRSNYKTADGYRLGGWVSNQRSLLSTGMLDQSRKARLDEIGFVWDAFDDGWEKRFSELTEYKNKLGDCRVPFGWVENIELSLWVGTQRQDKKKGRIDSERTSRLSEIGFDWNPNQSDWEKNFSALAELFGQENHLNVPEKYPKRPQLRRWVNKLREDYKKGKVPGDQVAMLNTLGFVWVPLEESWNIRYAELVEFKNRYGHCDVRERDNLKLAQWLTELRKKWKRRGLPPERLAELDVLGFVWHTREDDWDEMLTMLTEYKLQHGDCNVPVTHENQKFARWITTQRKAKKSGQITDDRIARLDAIGFAWIPFDDRWESSFRALEEYKNKYGSCDVPQKWKENPSLGKWVSDQRKKWRDKTLTAERVKRLESLGITWQPKN
ncbi:helicase, putative [Sulfuriferula multivorans]|uniref:Helicase, putative n=1 Tax=Sulfuriferula multivorans TaxID=1559896 RepID=A0A401JES1_9PROT|nr:DEAD/DEAH box helicase [Sulfuriferula multivorans]GBL46118.1 helicase, putative [Sulfuriferula multivorans]